MNNWREIGPVVLLQIQREPMKEGTTTRVYKPDRLAQVERIWLTPAGVTAELNGERVLMPIMPTIRAPATLALIPCRLD